MAIIVIIVTKATMAPMAPSVLIFEWRFLKACAIKKRQIFRHRIVDIRDKGKYYRIVDLQ